MANRGQQSGISRRAFVTGVGMSGFVTAASAGASVGKVADPPAGDGTPEQIHTTWGEDPATSVCVSWVSAARSVNPRIDVTQASKTRTVHALQRTYTDGLNGQTVFTYHAMLTDLPADSDVHYTVTADNDRNHAQPFSAVFRTAPRGRSRFRWTSYGDLATPNIAWRLSSPQSAFAVQAVERFQPLFHLLNGDLCYANLNPTAQPAVWADFGNNVQS